jgi:hypothetical protein
MTDLYHVRQYRPSFCSGFENAVVHDASYEKITEAPWFRNFQHEHDGGFEKFEIEPYGDELIISAIYKNGKHWVAGFAIKTDSKAEAPDGGLLVDNWRYKRHES